MKITEKVKKRVTQVDVLVSEVLCNKCGDDIFLSGFPDWLPAHEFEVVNFFGTKHYLQIHEFHLCDKCYCKMIKRFKIPVTKKQE